jgi:hypothetical protein
MRDSTVLHPLCCALSVHGSSLFVAGSINTLSTKWADNTYSYGRYTYDQFNHPFVQSVFHDNTDFSQVVSLQRLILAFLLALLCLRAFGMFIGESLCLAAFFFLNWRARRQGREDQIEKAHPDLPWSVLQWNRWRPQCFCNSTLMHTTSSHCAHYARLSSIIVSLFLGMSSPHQRPVTCAARLSCTSV